MIDIYKRLDIQDKRNEFSNLLLKTEELLNQLIMDKEIINISKIKNYDINNNNNMTEDEILTFFYEDLWNIKNKILALHIVKK